MENFTGGGGVDEGGLAVGALGGVTGDQFAAVWAVEEHGGSEV